MIILNENETLKIKLKDAHTTTQRDFSVAYGDSTGSILSEGGNKGRFSSTPVVMADHPAAGQKRIVKGFTVSNNDTVKGKFIIYIDDGNNETIVHQHPLNVGESFDSLANNNGGGGMEKSTYDPNLMEADAFNMDNMNDGTTKHYVTGEEKNTWNSKQDKLYSGVNLKTLNGIDLQGSGNIELDEITKVSKITLDDYIAGENFSAGQYGFEHTVGEGIDDIDIGKDTKRVATSFVGNGDSVEDMTIKVKKVGTPVGDLNFRIETDDNGKPSGQLIDPDATSVGIKQSDLTNEYQEIILESNNAGIYTPDVHLTDTTSNDSILGGIKFTTQKRTFLKSIKIDENCSANKILFWYEQGGNIPVFDYYSVSDGIANINIEIPVASTGYIVCISNDLTNTITNIRDNGVTYPLSGRGINITGGWAYNDETLITLSTTRTIYYNNNGTNTLAANTSDGQKFRAKHWTKISTVSIYNNAGNLLKCEIWNEDKTTKLGETQHKVGNDFIFDDPVIINKGQTFHIILTAGETAYTTMYYYNNYASVGPTNVDLEWLSDTDGHDIWKMINSITCLTYASENLSVNRTTTQSNQTGDGTYNRFYRLFGQNNTGGTYYAGVKYKVNKSCDFKGYTNYRYTHANYTNNETRYTKVLVNGNEIQRTWINGANPSGGWGWYTYETTTANPIHLNKGDVLEIRWRTNGYTTEDGNRRISYRIGNTPSMNNSDYVSCISTSNNLFSTTTGWKDYLYGTYTLYLDRPSTAGFNTVTPYSNITEIDVAEDVTLPKGVKCWLVGYVGNYGSETMNETSYYQVKSSDLETNLSKTYLDNYTDSNKNLYLINGPVLNKYILKPNNYAKINLSFSGCYPLMIPSNLIVGNNVSPDIYGMLPYIIGLSNGEVFGKTDGTLSNTWDANGMLKVGYYKSGKFFMEPELNCKFNKPVGTSDVRQYLHKARGRYNQLTGGGEDFNTFRRYTLPEYIRGTLWESAAVNNANSYQTNSYFGENGTNSWSINKAVYKNPSYLQYEGWEPSHPTNQYVLSKGQTISCGDYPNNGTAYWYNCRCIGPKMVTLKTWNVFQSTGDYQENTNAGEWTADKNYYGPLFVSGYLGSEQSYVNGNYGIKIYINGVEAGGGPYTQIRTQDYCYVGTYKIKKGDKIKIYQNGYNSSHPGYTYGLYFGDIL